jgi:hypothetical protein
MNDEPARQPPPRAAARRGRGFRRHELELPDGSRLLLRVDGSIDHVDADGATTRSWAPDDPEWPDQAIRFGLRPQPPTVRPQDGHVPGTRPPSW